MYYSLETHPILNNLPSQPLVSVHLLKKLLLQCYKSNSFSTFPYISNKFNSKQAIQYMNSGNCISLSLYLKNELIKKNIISYLIPCSIPSFYKRPGYLDISHVSLLVPKTQNIIYILDPAFYFIDPICINLNLGYNKIENTNCTGIYDDTTMVIESIVKRLINDTIYNKFQTIYKNTILCECNYTFNKSDKWNYYLLEILNPDLAISTFYLNIVKYPFITTTYIENDRCKMNVYIRIIDADNIKISVKHKLYYQGLIKQCPQNILDDVDSKVSTFFIGKLHNYIYSYPEFNRIIYD